MPSKKWWKLKSTYFYIAVSAVILGLGYTAFQRFDNLIENSRSDYRYQPARDTVKSRSGVVGSLNSLGYQPACQNPVVREDSELCAQWSAVEAVAENNELVRVSLWLTAISLIVTTIGTGILIRTIRQTESALSHARETSRSELRPWLIYDGYQLNPFKDGFDDGVPVARGILGHLVFQNVGNSPGLKCFAYSDIGVTPFGSDPPVFKVPDVQPLPASVGQGRTINTASRMMGPEETDDFMKRISNWWIFGAVYYEEPAHLGAAYITTVTVRLEYGGKEILPDGTQRDRVTGLVTGPQNNMT